MISSSSRGSGSRKLEKPVVLFRSLSTLVSAGVPIHRSLELLADSSENENDQFILRQLCLDVSRGKTLSVGMSKFSQAFSDYIVSLIRVGEKTGALVTILETIAEHSEKSDEIRLKMRSALVLSLIHI